MSSRLSWSSIFLGMSLGASQSFGDIFFIDCIVKSICVIYQMEIKMYNGLVDYNNKRNTPFLIVQSVVES